MQRFKIVACKGLMLQAVRNSEALIFFSRYMPIILPGSSATEFTGSFCDALRRISHFLTYGVFGWFFAMSAGMKPALTNRVYRSFGGYRYCRPYQAMSPV